MHDRHDCTHLAQVELSVLLGGNALDLEEGSVGAAVALGPLVAQNATLGVKSAEPSA